MKTRQIAGSTLMAALILIALDSGFAEKAFAASGADTRHLSYPSARRGDQVDDYHGVKIADPYRWMEEVDSTETRAWVAAEATLARDYLNAIPGRDRIAQRLKEIWNFERWGAPEKHGGGWSYSHNDGLQNQSVLFTTSDPGQPARVLLDPNGLAQDGTIAFKGAGYSNDGIGNIGPTLYVLTDDAAPKYRVIAVDLRHPGREHWRSVVPESADTLDSATFVGHQIVALYLHDAHSRVRRFSPTGKSLEDVALPGLGAASGFAGRIDDAVTYYSYTRPGNPTMARSTTRTSFGPCWPIRPTSM